MIKYGYGCGYPNMFYFWVSVRLWTYILTVIEMQKLETKAIKGLVWTAVIQVSLQEWRCPRLAGGHPSLHSVSAALTCWRSQTKPAAPSGYGHTAFCSLRTSAISEGKKSEGWVNQKHIYTYVYLCVCVYAYLGRGRGGGYGSCSIYVWLWRLPPSVSPG